MKKTFNLVATAAAGLEAVVGREIRDLGIDCQVENGKVRFQGDVRTIITTNLWLRAADRVKIVVGEFPARTFEELFQGVYKLDWENYLPLGAKFPISKAKCVKSKLHNEPSVQAISKKAVVKKLQKVYHRPDGVPLQENGAEFRIEVSILKDKVTVMIDTTGASLFKRGYRVEKGGAPSKENMAAAIIELSNWYPDKPFIDPTCGSGTFCIEAAMIGANIAPGMNREFLSETWNHLIPKKAWYNAIEEAADVINRDVKMNISGFDIDGEVIKLARQNAMIAGVDQHIHFQQKPVSELSSAKKYGFVITNPPYGERISEKAELPKLYKEIGQRYKELDSWSLYMITSYEDAEKYIGKKADKNRKIYNGMLKTYFYQFMGPKPPKQNNPGKNDPIRENKR